MTTTTWDDDRIGIDGVESSDDADLIRLVQGRRPGDSEREAAS